MYTPQEGIGPRGALVPGPPWILGFRGAPREAPENTLAGLARALELGLDGFHYEVRACKSGELFLLADANLDRTTDAVGPLLSRTLPELYGIDAGGSFSRRFLGEPLPLLDEALALPGNQAGAFPQHVIELAEPGLLDDVVRALAGRPAPRSVRIASTHRGVCKAAQEAGFSSMLLAVEAGEDERLWTRDDHVAACAVAPGGWRTAAGRRDWTCERWCVGLDDPADLLEACRMPLFGFSTTEPARALAVRALAHLTPHDRGPYPLQAPELPVRVAAGEEHAAWRGDWTVAARVRNPFAFRVRLALDLVVRRGAFEAEGLPALAQLAPGEEHEFAFRLHGGSWVPGGDPLLVAHYRWSLGPGRPGEGLALDAPLVRVREVALGELAERLFLIPERPGDPPASLTARRQGRHLLVAIENAGGLSDARLVAHLDGTWFSGGRGLRMLLPRDFESRERGVAFSAGVVGRERGRTSVRRWAGGVPRGLDAGAPGRLLAKARG